MENLEVLTKEQEFLNSMIDLSNYALPAKAGENYSLKDKKYSCDPCDACGPASCAQCKGCAVD